MSSPKVVQVVVNRPLRGPNQVFAYIVPEALQEKVAPGVRVAVPFGRQTTTGFVVGTGREAVPGLKLKEIVGVLDEEPPVPPALLELACWVASRYVCTLREALVAIYGPASQGQKQKPDQAFWFRGEPAEVLQELERLRAPVQARALSLIAAQPGVTRRALLREGIGAKAIAALIRKGLVATEAVPVWREPYRDVAVEKEGPPVLSPEQQAALQEIRTAVSAQQHQVFLLHGVTGSGKTEVYLQAAAAALEAGRQAIVLVPEIALAHQMVLQFKARFGSQVAITHSALGAGERRDEWERVRSGEANVVLGARSAVFAPVARPGLVVVDEEHEPAYKQEQAPRYHAREVAIARAAFEGAPVVLGSATPALESYAQLLSGRYRELRLSRRVDGRRLPVVRVVDLREEFRAGTISLLSNLLIARIREKLRQQEQVLLFLNRRGFAAFVLCPACGNVIRCPNCDIALTYHRPETLLCHYCYYRMRYEARCPRCGNTDVGRYGAGTQRVEEEARALFPEARVARMDAETTARRGSHAAILDAFKAGAIDILIGTQMVAKGLDVPGVTLVGVVNADTTLLLPDFRAAERTFQLLYQVAGRAGRGDLPGEVIVQSHCPEHYAVRLSALQDFSAFARREMSLRQRFGYPPYTFMIRVVFSGPAGDKVVRSAEEFGVLAKAAAGKDMTVLGPAPCPFGRLKGFYRWHIILKGKQGQVVRDACREVLRRFTGRRFPGVRIAVDAAPQSML